MDGYITIGTNLDTKSFDAQIDYIERQLEEIEHKLKQADMGFEVGDTAKLEAQYERLTNQLGKLKQKQIDLNRTDLSNIQNSIEKVGNSTSSVIKKVGRWALAIFGIRSAYNFVRNSMSTLSQYNEQIASDVEYIQFALASMLQPLIERMIQLAYRLLSYVNYIAKAWFGVDLFANASADAMNRGAKSAEQMKKSLAGFDEMNVINDNGTTGAMGATPSMDLFAPEDAPVPGWLDFIVTNGETLLSILSGVTIGLIALKMGLGGITSLGIGVLLAGVILSITNLIDFIKDPSWDNFADFLASVSILLGGIALLTGNWIVALVALGVAIVSAVIKNWDTIKEILSTVGSWIYDHIIKPVGDFFVNLWDGIVNGVKTAVQWVKDAFSSVVSFFSNLISKIVNLFKTIGTKVGDAISGAFKTVVNGVLKAVESILNFPINSINKLINVINKVPGIDLGTLPTFNLPRLAVGGVVNMPGRGVMVGSAIAGERGPEGVIPLTNSQMMSELGEAIGRYITINANITNTMNGRVISRELQKINTNNDFAMNR